MQNKHHFFFSFGGPNFGGGGVDLVGPNSQIFPKIRFEGSPYGMYMCHPASRVTLWVSHGKFASRTSFQGGLLFSSGGPFFSFRGASFFWHEKWKFTFRGALAPLKENCILSSKLVIWTYCQTFLHYYAAKVGLDPQICISFCQIWQYIYKGSKHIHMFWCTVNRTWQCFVWKN